MSLPEDGFEEMSLDLESIDRATRALQEREAVIAAALRGMRVEALELDALQLPALRSRGEWLTATSGQIRELRLGVEATSEQSGHVSSRVRQLHTARGRVRNVLGRVEQLVALERCSQEVEAALASGDFQAAVEQ
eukprot:7019224-Prymnesium_polylepis.1